RSPQRCAFTTLGCKIVTPRNAERILLRYPLDVVLKSGRRIMVRTLNVSGSGMLVQSVLPIKIGSTVRVQANMVPMFNGDALVRHCVRRGLAYKIGLEFDAPLRDRF